MFAAGVGASAAVLLALGHIEQDLSVARGDRLPAQLLVHDMDVDGKLDPDREVLGPAVVPGMQVRRSLRYVPPPGYRWR